MQYRLNTKEKDARPGLDMRDVDAGISQRVAGPFHDRADISRDLQHELHRAMSADTRLDYFEADLDAANAVDEIGRRALQGAGVGGAIGGTLGGAAAALIGTGATLAAPEVGLVIAGPIATALAGAGIGSLVGVLSGALLGWNTTGKRIRHDVPRTNTGSMITGVRSPAEADSLQIETQWNSGTGDYVRR